MATITTQNILDENNWTIADISLANIELLVNNAINYINLQTGLSISNMASGTVTVTSGESPIIKALTLLMIKAYKDRGPNTAIAGLGVNTLITDPQYSLFIQILNDGINRLRGRSIERT